MPATNVVATDGQSSVTVNWTQPSNTKSAQVYRSAIQGQIGPLLATVKKPPYTDLTAVPGAVYWYGIKLQGPNGPYSVLSVQESGYIATPSPPVITTTSLDAAQVGVPCSDTLAASGGTLPYVWSLDAGALPAGVALSSSGIVSGTPTSSGTFGLIVKCADANGLSATQALSMSVASAVAPLAIVTSSLPDATVGVPYSTQIVATGGAPPYTASLDSGALPDGLALSSAGVISGTPTAVSTAAFNVGVTDSAP